METLLTKMDGAFKRETADEAYDSYEKFENERREGTTNINDFIIRFERAYNSAKKHGMNLPDSVRAYKLLKSANLNNSERHLVLSGCQKLEYETVKSALRRVFGGTGIPGGNLIVEEEPVFAATSCNKNQSYRRQEGRNRFTSSGGKNPLNKFGSVSRCKRCGSTYHWVKDCPEQHPESAKVTSTQSTDDEPVVYAEFDEALVLESLGMAILDTGCTATVCGLNWMKFFEEMMLSEDRSQIRKMPSSKIICFGDNAKYPSLYSLVVPVYINNQRISLGIEVVDTEVPLLLSKSTLSKMKANIDLATNKYKLFGKEVKTFESTFGHTMISLLKQDVAEVFLTQEEKRLSKKEIEKLHRQFGHCKGEKLNKLLSTQRFYDKDLEKAVFDVTESCDTCKKYGRAKPKPSVGLPQADIFNGCVSLDLHQLSILGKTAWYLHILDQFSRFSMAQIVHTKMADQILDVFVMEWVRIFGPPRRILTDNGKEFVNSQFQEFCALFDINHLTTAAESPFSNGTIERHNAVLTETFLKLLEETKTSPRFALAHAVFAKNAITNSTGFSPHQMVFGSNARFPSVLDAEPPALISNCTHEVVAKHLNSLILAGNKYLEADSSARIKRALRTNLRCDSGPFINGESVYYKRADECWRGPATVIGHDNTVVVLRHAGFIVRVHPTRLRHRNFGEREESPIDGLQSVSDEADAIKSVDKDLLTVSQPDSDDDDCPVKTPETVNPSPRHSS